MSEDLEKSYEYLRLVLPMMGRFRIPVTPPNYAVWYSYVAGTNVALREAVDEALSSETGINEDWTGKLYKTFLDRSEPARVEASAERVEAMVDSVMALVSTADANVNSFAASVEQSKAELRDTMEVEDVRAITGRLAASAGEMSEKNLMLRNELRESRRESEALRAELEKARQESRSDALTGLANRAALEEGFARISAAPLEESGIHALLIADIDRFKAVNDSYGHVFGDKVIRVIAKVLRGATKGRDLVSRFGGEEFVVLLPGTPLEGGLAVADDIRRRVERGRILNTRTGEEISHVTISLGVTDFETGESMQDVLARADSALYRAKNGGRNRVMAVRC